MLSAAPSREGQKLDLLVFALSLIGSGNREVPDPLKEYLRRVLTQAKELAADPSHITGGIMPEAIQLALQMRKEKSFSSQVEAVAKDDTVSAEHANRLLTAVEQAFVREN